jgi:hypothetical protein
MMDSRTASLIKQTSPSAYGLVLALLWKSGERGQAMWKVKRLAGGGLAVFALSGRIEAAQASELQKLFHAQGLPLVLDLGEIELVDREIVRFLARWQDKGARLQRCPAYIRAWMEREKQRE